MRHTSQGRWSHPLVSAALAMCALIVGPAASACTIPVFRYALERWEADRQLVVVYYSGELTSEQQAAVSELSHRSSLHGGPLNIEVVHFNTAADVKPNLPDVRPPAYRPLPWVEVRSRLRGAQTAVQWQGTLADAASQAGVFDSPAREQIAQRLLSGDSAVWLVVSPAAQTPSLAEQVKRDIAEVTKELSLPNGVGLPGSELYAPIPLDIRFSFLAVSQEDPAEQQFLQQLAALSDHWRSDGSYVIPVFGRLRALEVIPGEEVDIDLVRDVSEFFCAACSCRVKQANPGFDLLASVEWNQRLFGTADGQPIKTPILPVTADAGNVNQPAELVTIPIGSVRAAESIATERLGVVTPPSDSAPRTERGLLRSFAARLKTGAGITMMALAAAGALAGVIYLSRRRGSQLN